MKYPYFVLFAVAVMAAILFLTGASPAYTMDDTTIRLGDLLAPWTEMLVGAVSVLVSAFLGWIATKINAKTGIDIEARHREALQTALVNAAGLAIAKLGGKVTGIAFDVRSPAIRHGVEYVARAVPDAVAKFGLGPDRLAEMLVAKIGLATAPTPILDENLQRKGTTT